MIVAFTRCLRLTNAVTHGESKLYRHVSNMISTRAWENDGQGDVTLIKDDSHTPASKFHTYSAAMQQVEVESLEAFQSIRAFAEK